MWDVRDVGCVMWDVGRLLECGMLIYKMPPIMFVDADNNKNLVSTFSSCFLEYKKIKFSFKIIIIIRL